MKKSMSGILALAIAIAAASVGPSAFAQDAVLPVGKSQNLSGLINRRDGLGLNTSEAQKQKEADALGKVSGYAHPGSDDYGNGPGLDALKDTLGKVSSDEDEADDSYDTDYEQEYGAYDDYLDAQRERDEAQAEVEQGTRESAGYAETRYQQAREFFIRTLESHGHEKARELLGHAESEGKRFIWRIDRPNPMNEDTKISAPALVKSQILRQSQAKLAGFTNRPKTPASDANDEARAAGADVGAAVEALGNSVVTAGGTTILEKENTSPIDPNAAREILERKYTPGGAHQ